MLVAPSPPAKLVSILQGLWTGGPRAGPGLQASLGRVPHCDTAQGKQDPLLWETWRPVTLGQSARVVALSGAEWGPSLVWSI